MLRDNLRKFREARGLSQQQLAVVCVLALAGGLAYLLGTQANRFAEGFEQGFQLQGTWKVLSDEGPFTTVSFGFTDADEGVWQIADFLAYGAAERVLQGDCGSQFISVAQRAA